MMTIKATDNYPKVSYLWFVISTLPYCSIQSLPTMMLCTQQVGLVHVYASLCLQNKNETNTQKNKREILFGLEERFVSNAINWG